MIHELKIETPYGPELTATGSDKDICVRQLLELVTDNFSPKPEILFEIAAVLNFLTPSMVAIYHDAIFSYKITETVAPTLDTYHPEGVTLN